jgi:hypothetical protein
VQFQPLLQIFTSLGFIMFQKLLVAVALLGVFCPPVGAQTANSSGSLSGGSVGVSGAKSAAGSVSVTYQTVQPGYSAIKTSNSATSTPVGLFRTATTSNSASDTLTNTGTQPAIKSVSAAAAIGTKEATAETRANADGSTSGSARGSSYETTSTLKARTERYRNGNVRLSTSEEVKNGL